MIGSTSQLVLIPSYNTGPRLVETVCDALKYWQPVWVIIDGSSDASVASVAELASREPHLRVLALEENSGKGAAVLHGMKAAQAAGFTRALVMDADGQHPAHCIPEFMSLSAAEPDAMVLGVPQFGSEAPKSREQGRRVGNWWANLETLWGGIEDSLFGFRVYPIPESIEILERTGGARRYDFDSELAVRLYWRGVRPINVLVPVRYFTKEQGGVSHFHYVRDNLLLIAVHTRLVLEMLPKVRRLLRYRRRR